MKFMKQYCIYGSICIVSVNITATLSVDGPASPLLFSPQKRKRETINHLTDDNILDCMAKLPVTKLMTQDCKDLRVVASLFLVLSKRERGRK